MAFELKIVGEKVLEITYKGKVTKEEILAVRKNAVTMIDKNSLDKMFINLSRANPDLTKVDIFNIAASNKKVYPKIIKTAILYDPGNMSEEDLNLYKNSANSRGWNIEIFMDKKKAKKWLTD